MTDEAAKTAVLLTLRLVGEAEPTDLTRITGVPIEVVMWALDRLREDEVVRCRICGGREWWHVA